MATYNDDLRRQDTGEMELGITEATMTHVPRRVVRPPPASAGQLAWEKKRPRWLREMIAEGTGVFFYVYAGVSAVASLTFGAIENSAKTNGAQIGSLTNVGFGFALGIAFAIITCGAVSGGHFNPAITLCFVLYQKFPISKACRYVFAQICGAFVAGLIIYGQYRQQFRAVRGLVPNLTLASVFCAVPLANQSLGYLFFIEFFVDSFIGIVIWSVLDPANPFIAASSAPFVVGLAYAAMVWGFADITISTNLARDLGTRMVAAIFFGKEVFTYKSYSWIAILVNVPATVFAVTFYEFVLKDTHAAVAGGHLSHPNDYYNDMGNMDARRGSNTDTFTGDVRDVRDVRVDNGKFEREIV